MTDDREAILLLSAIPADLRAALQGEAVYADLDGIQQIAERVSAGEEVFYQPPAMAALPGMSVSPTPAREAAPAPATVSRVPAAVVDRLWLRGTTSLLGAMGLALTAVATATYLLTAGNDTGTWVALGTAAVITVATPAILVAFTRRLSDAIDAVEG